MQWDIIPGVLSRASTVSGFVQLWAVSAAQLWVSQGAVMFLWGLVLSQRHCCAHKLPASGCPQRIFLGWARDNGKDRIFLTGLNKAACAPWHARLAHGKCQRPCSQGWLGEKKQFGISAYWGGMIQISSSVFLTQKLQGWTSLEFLPMSTSDFSALFSITLELSSLSLRN